ncbi:MAG TPA: ABC transporter ATP-binding protein [Iamia sp.]|nr:ABC transporter ATP-binding protein [Iamia sp.]
MLETTTTLDTAAAAPGPPSPELRPGTGAGGVPSAISVRGVSMAFAGRAGQPTGTTALAQVDLEIPVGQFVAIVGASGCGKTTLLNLIAGAIQPTHGSLEVSGQVPTRPLPTTGYMLARDGLLPWRTIRRNVEFGLEHRKVPREERRRRSTELLELVGLSDFASAYPRQLSQGMRQRAALARTLAVQPDVLLMDEPFAALDARTKLTLQREFLRIWEGEGAERQTVVFVTHDLQEALLLADRLIVMLPRPGRVAVDQMVDLPRPRGEHLSEMMFTHEFRVLYQSLFDVLEGDVNVEAGS